ncbi:MAG: lipoprotein-releasing system ATP-binding protein LolD [Planctomycetota bacterium]|nr:MAG: lipoprotein-releasing system ATP-binding protein LolD [Planctomycetota bacterium]
MSDVHPPAAKELVLDARGLTRRYRMGATQLDVLQGAELQLARGEIVAIIGRSGVGKSTLLHLLGLLDRPDAGSMKLAGVETTKLSKAARARLRNQHVGFVFQFYHLFPELSALENAMLPGMITHRFFAWRSKRAGVRERAKALLERLELGERLKHKPGQLSGGERQRVAIARALAGRPSLLLCDEPTGNLDERTSESITNLLLDLAREHGQSLVLVTHDPELARRADRCLTMHEGRLVPAEVATEIAHPSASPASGSPE